MFRITFSSSFDISDNISGIRSSLFSETKIILFFHKLFFGSSILSESNIGIQPQARDSQNLIEFGPVPEGHKLYLDFKRI